MEKYFSNNRTLSYERGKIISLQNVGLESRKIKFQNSKKLQELVLKEEKIRNSQIKSTTLFEIFKQRLSYHLAAVVEMLLAVDKARLHH